LESVVRMIFNTIKNKQTINKQIIMQGIIMVIKIYQLYIGYN
jgi:hypothetical protein